MAATVVVADGSAPADREEDIAITLPLAITSPILTFFQKLSPLITPSIWRRDCCCCCCCKLAEESSGGVLAAAAARYKGCCCCCPWLMDTAIWGQLPPPAPPFSCCICIEVPCLASSWRPLVSPVSSKKSDCTSFTADAPGFVPTSSAAAGVDPWVLLSPFLPLLQKYTSMAMTTTATIDPMTAPMTSTLPSSAGVELGGGGAGEGGGVLGVGDGVSAGLLSTMAANVHENPGVAAREFVRRAHASPVAG